MATLTASGIGSGLDIASLVQQLTTAETAATTNRLNRNTQTTQAKISAWGVVNGALSALETKAKALESGGSASAWKATSSDESLFTATAGSTAASGSHSIEILTLAQAHRLASTTYANADAAVGTGTLHIEVGSESFDVVIGDSQKSLAGIRDAINTASGNTGVQASLLNAGGSTRLILTSKETGTEHALRITQSGGDGGLAALVYDPGVSEQLSQVQAAIDTTIKVDGFTHTSSSRTISDVIPGVTLTLKGAAPGSLKTLDVSSDSTAQKSAIQGFVTAYNTAVAAVNNVSRYNAGTGEAAALNGDSTVRYISRSLRDSLQPSGVQTPSQIHSLSEIGITTQTDGTLTINEAKLNAALSADPERVMAVFSGAQGVAPRFTSLLSGILGNNGRVDAQTDRLQGQLTAISKQRTALASRQADLEDRFRRQFNALDTLVAQLKSTGNYLSQQLSQLA